MTLTKKLIEVALPLVEINEACTREKSIRHGHPSTLHLWWARRPLAAARAVIFAQLVDDPSGYVEELRKDADLLRVASRDLRERLKIWREKHATYEKATAAGMRIEHPGEEPSLDAVLIERERERLFSLIRQLIQWENTTNETVLEPAREEIRKSWRRTCMREGMPENTPLPAFHDPFAGGGAIPLEAQRLGLESHATDLNPVAVLINKAMIEIPPKFAGRPPVHPGARQEMGTTGWKGATGMAEDIRRYGLWMREEAQKSIGHLYPPVEITAEMATERPDLKPLIGQKLTVIAWIWARTVKSPNPAFSHVDVPLASTFILSSKAGKEAYVQPVINGDSYRFTVKLGTPPVEAEKGTKLARGANFRCLLSNIPIGGGYIKSEGCAKRMGAKLMAVVAEGTRSRVYLAPTAEMEAVATAAIPTWKPETSLPDDQRNFWTTNYGLTTYGDLFTPRQLVALTTFSDLIGIARDRVEKDALAAGLSTDGMGLDAGGAGAKAYAEAVSVYLAFAVSKVADRNSSICGWDVSRDSLRNTFGRQAIPMVWDFAEGNPIEESAGSYSNGIDQVARVLDQAVGSSKCSKSSQADAQTQAVSQGKCISSDPPYYDNIGYADLSDFFYVWLRKSLRPIFPALLSTIAVPKAEELVATPYRHGGKSGAEAFFLDGMTKAMLRVSQQANPRFPVTIYYAFKQSETDNQNETASTGWETFLEAVIRSGFAISGTWPMRTELGNRMIGRGTNALASSIILVCRQRPSVAPMATRREFEQALQRELPLALRDLQLGNIAPVDLPQSSIGPGMAIYTRYSRVVEADGSSMPVRTALQRINGVVDEFLSSQEAQMDEWTRFAVTWFAQYGFQQGPFGDAQNVATARNVSVEGVREAGIIESGGGKVRILKPVELDDAWDPSTDNRLTVWEILHHMVRLLKTKGEGAAATILGKVGAQGDDVRALCYRLYTLCEQKKWADEAWDYNALIIAWPELNRLAQDQSAAQTTTQGELGMNV